MNITKRILTASLFLILITQSCKKDEDDADANLALFNETTKTGYIYYQDGDILSPAGGSPHGDFKLRFNQVAQTALDTAGELPFGGTFPTGSVLVKEVFSGNTLTLVVVMEKAPSDEYAAGSWLWGEYNPDGSTVYSVVEKGDACISCHNVYPNRDLTRTFDLH